MIQEVKTRFIQIKSGKPIVISKSHVFKSRDHQIKDPILYSKSSSSFSSFPNHLAFSIPVIYRGEKSAITSIASEIDYTKYNNEVFNELKAHLYQWNKKPYRLKIDITYYVNRKSGCQDFAGLKFSVDTVNELGIKVGSKRVFEVCSKRDFYFFNTKSCMWYSDVVLLSIPDYGERFPKNIKWAKQDEPNALAIFRSHQVMKLGYDLWRVQDDSPLPFHWAKINFFIEELKHYIAIVYGKMPTLKSRPENKNPSKSVLIALYQNLAKYAERYPEKFTPNTFSYAHFKTHTDEITMRAIDELYYVLVENRAPAWFSGTIDLISNEYGTKSDKIFRYEEIKELFLSSGWYSLLISSPNLFVKECKLMVKYMKRNPLLFKDAKLFEIATKYSKTKDRVVKDLMDDLEVVRREEVKEPTEVEKPKRKRTKKK